MLAAETAFPTVPLKHCLGLGVFDVAIDVSYRLHPRPVYNRTLGTRNGRMMRANKETLSRQGKFTSVVAIRGQQRQVTCKVRMTKHSPPLPHPRSRTAKISGPRTIQSCCEGSRVPNNRYHQRMQVWPSTYCYVVERCSHFQTPLLAGEVATSQQLSPNALKEFLCLLCIFLFS